MAEASKTERPEQWNIPLVQLIQELKIESWDLLLVGDGSGSKWEYGIGWACVAIEKGSKERKVFYGAANNGTVNISEPMAYLIPLSWYVAKIEETKFKGAKRIHIITDSQYVRDRGSRDQTATTGAHTVLWAAIELLSRKGFIIEWHWIDRDTYALNSCVDAISRASRITIESHAEDIGISDQIYQANED